MAASLPQNKHVSETDPELAALIAKEKERQMCHLELIASENFTSRAVMDVLGSCLTNKYSEGLPGARYYGGNEFIDQVENLCIKRALETFRLNADFWGVNVQPYSGSTANFAAFTGLLNPHDRIMGLDLPSGGHLTHGYQTDKKKISATSIYFESMPYQVNMKTGFIDYDRLEENAALFRPRMIIAGASAYPREWDYARLRKIADKHSALLLVDMAHFSGLVASGELANPFEFADVVTTTTHKSLRGPRAAMIFFLKKKKNAKGELEPTDYESRINFAVFPSCQGGPHENAIGAIATALKEANTPEFKQYSHQVRLNARRLAEELVKMGYSLVTGGTDNHLLLWDVRPQGLTGSKLEKLYELASISLNKNAVYGDVSALAPGGVRVGTPALTSRGFKEEDFAQVAHFLDRGMKIAIAVQEKSGKQLKDFVAALHDNADLKALKADVEKFAHGFPMPG